VANTSPTTTTAMTARTHHRQSLEAEAEHEQSAETDEGHGPSRHPQEEGDLARTPPPSGHRLPDCHQGESGASSAVTLCKLRSRFSGDRGTGGPPPSEAQIESRKDEQVEQRGCDEAAKDDDRERILDFVPGDPPGDDEWHECEPRS
jgi:hypothetical protein